MNKRFLALICALFGAPLLAIDAITTAPVLLEKIAQAPSTLEPVISGTRVGPQAIPVKNAKFVLPTEGTVKGKNYVLPELPYAYNSLKPYIDTKTMHIHHDKHHQKYVDKLNEALTSYPKLQGMPLDELLRDPDALPKEVREKIIHNGGGHYNHSLYWRVMGKKVSHKPLGKLAEAIDAEYGNFDLFKSAFTAASEKVFGSGWTWLSVSPSGKLSITTTANQDTPLKDGLTPIVCLDEWEHAYYLKYKNERASYIKQWWNVVNWEYISELYSITLNNK